ncbi:hypothetical protein F4825DRAFT_432325 [Nemania diffusa]|nr:hypothetical protein F4825DRAFT_432325 [Nemania diffusa]
MAAVADQQQQQQPDFHALSGHFQGMSIEVDGCSNLVAVREANVLEAIAQLSTNVNTAVATLNTSIAALHTGIGTINTSLAALHTDVNKISTSLAALCTDANRINTSLAALRTDVNTITTSVGDLRTEMHEKMQDMQASMKNFDYNAKAQTLNIMTHRFRLFYIG